MLTILSIAYPLARVSRDAVGGAEQVLCMLDTAIAAAGHRSIVVACEGSKVRGELVAVPAARGLLDSSAVAAARECHRQAIHQVLRSTRVDVVHMHGVDFDAYLPPEGVPVLATLHCPAEWYTAAALSPCRPGTYLNAVSTSQNLRLAPRSCLIEPVENGIEIESLAGRHRRRSFALMLTRIAPEKGVHLALQAARAAGVPLLVAGELFAYPEHRRYFSEWMEPLLDRQRRYIGAVGFAAKRRLLQMARCLVVCSQVPETSSLAAREALAAGTPVVAVRQGALTEVVEDGSTGFLVDDVHSLAAAMQRVDALDHDACTSAARRRFDARGMTRRYLRIYERLAHKASATAHARAGAA
jgi:glycosyltransferase involved in cell wall biosynthesis